MAKLLGNANKKAPVKSFTKEKKNNGKVLVFGDVHTPFTKDEYLEFLKEQRDIHKPDQIVCLGDFFDLHALSNWDMHPDAVGTITEIELSKEWVRKYAEVFPELVMTLGNHDIRMQRKAAKAGISEVFVKNLYELFDIPETWTLTDEFLYNEVLYIHGTSTSKDSALDNAKVRMMSTCSGHAHSNMGVKYFNNGYKEIFGLNPGCLVDVETYAMAYNGNAQKKESFGCGIVYNTNYAIVIPYDGYNKTK